MEKYPNILVRKRETSSDYIPQTILIKGLRSIIQIQYIEQIITDNRIVNESAQYQTLG